MAETGCDSSSFTSRCRGWKDHNQTGFLTDLSPRQFQAGSVRIQLSHPTGTRRGTEKGAWLYPWLIKRSGKDSQMPQLITSTSTALQNISYTIKTCQWVGLNPPPFPRQLSSNRNSVMRKKKSPAVRWLTPQLSIYLTCSFSSGDTRHWHAHCAHGEADAQCTGERRSPILLTSGSFCFELLWMLCTPRARAGGETIPCLLKPCSPHDETEGHCLVTHPGTLGSDLSRSMVTSALIKRNWIAGALPLWSLWWWTIREKLEPLWCQKMSLHSHYIACKQLQDFNFMDTVSCWQWDIQGQLVLPAVQVVRYLTCHRSCPELFESTKQRLLSK